IRRPRVFIRSSSGVTPRKWRPCWKASSAIARPWRSIASMSIVMARAPWGLRSVTSWGLRSCPGSKPSLPQSFIALSPAPPPLTARHTDYPLLPPILPHPTQWALIRQQYDKMVKYPTALRLGTADADTILKRFTRENLQHPTYQALVELGKAVKTHFLCHYLH